MQGADAANDESEAGFDHRGWPMLEQDAMGAVRTKGLMWLEPLRNAVVECHGKASIIPEGEN